MSQSCRDALQAPNWVRLQVGLPESENPPATGASVGVLTAVQSNPFANPRLRAAAVTVVPVVTVELDEQLSGFDCGVRGELAAEQPLAPVGSVERVEDGVPSRFGLGGLGGLLLKRVQGTETCLIVGVGVAAGDRAVLGCAVGGEARREAVLPAAREAGVDGFVPSLPCDLASSATEAGETDPSGWCVEDHTAVLAGDISPTMAGYASAAEAAVLLSSGAVAEQWCGTYLATATQSGCGSFARQRAVTSVTATGCHVERNGTGLTRLGNAAAIALRRHVLQSIRATGEWLRRRALAARLSGRRAVCIEAHEPYLEAAARRLDQGVLDFDGSEAS